MSTSALKKNLHNYIDTMDDNFLRVMHAMAKEYMTTYSEPLSLTREQMIDLKKRIARHKNGESRSYSWAEAKALARGRMKK